MAGSADDLSSLQRQMQGNVRNALITDLTEKFIEDLRKEIAVGKSSFTRNFGVPTTAVDVALALYLKGLDTVVVTNGGTSVTVGYDQLSGKPFDGETVTHLVTGALKEPAPQPHARVLKTSRYVPSSLTWGA